MMWQLLLGGMLLGATAGMAPGPLLALVVSQTLRYGVMEGLKVAAAPFITDLPIILVAFWFAARFHNNFKILGMLSLLGAVYVAYLAWKGLRAGAADNALKAPGPSRSISKGALVNLLNPHPYLFWLTVGTPFLIKSWSRSPAGAVLWVAGFYLMLVGSKAMLAVLAGRSRTYFTGGMLVWINRLLAVVLIFFAALLLKDGLKLLTVLAV